MRKKALLVVVILWILLTLFNYYYMNFFFLAFELIGLIIILFIITLIQLIKLINERKNLKNTRIRTLAVFGVLLILTIFRFIPNRLIEWSDWFLFYGKRSEIVEKVKSKELNSNVSWNNWVCELPFEFPVVSNGGNDIGIIRHKDSEFVTVNFWVFRNFMDSPSTYFIFSDNPETIERLEKKTVSRPKDNWKLRDNWYRIYGEY